MITAPDPQKRRWLKTGFWVLAVVLLVALIHGVRLVSPKSVEAAIDKNLGPESDSPI
jgi:hypothetical protein